MEVDYSFYENVFKSEDFYYHLRDKTEEGHDILLFLDINQNNDQIILIFKCGKYNGFTIAINSFQVLGYEERLRNRITEKIRNNKIDEILRLS